MDRFALALLAGIVGGAAGALAVHWIESPSRASTVAPGSDDASLRDVKEQLAEVRRLLERPAPASLTGGSSRGAGAGARPAGESSDDPGAGRPASTRAYAPEEIAAIAEKAAEAALEKRNEKEAAAKEPPKKRAPLSEVARDLNLSASQESDIRDAYREAGDKFLKLMAEPDGDVEAVRRELAESKGNKPKQAGLMVKYLPKVLSKFPEMMSIQAERDARVEKALGTPESHAKFQQYKVEEEDPFDFGGGDMSIGVTSK